MKRLLITSILVLQGCGASGHTNEVEVNETRDIQFIAGESLKASGFPLSSAVEANGWIFLSGALGTVQGKGFVERGIEPETRQTLENIKSTLREQGLGMERIVKCTAMLADMSEWSAFNAVYKTYFDTNFPARSAFAVSGLAADARVEIECIARR
ncbi:MAG: RidA family protein [Alphaproteobacteria bacterium]